MFLSIIKISVRQYWKLSLFCIDFYHLIEYIASYYKHIYFILQKTTNFFHSRFWNFKRKEWSLGKFSKDVESYSNG